MFKPFKVGRYFSLKDPSPFALRSLVVYKFVCSVDQSIFYIGKTKRHLCTRIREHLSSSSSAIFSHRLSCNCSCSAENFSIISSACNDFDLCIKEALHIKDKNPSLNCNLQNNGSIFLKVF